MTKVAGIQVFCSICQEEKDEETVEVLNIEEDIQGYDVLTFKCPDCDTVRKSHRVGRLY